MMTIKLPRIYGRDWLERYDGEWPAVVAETSRTITLALDQAALDDIREDVRHYTDPTMRKEYVAEGYRALVRSADAARKVLVR